MDLISKEQCICNYDFLYVPFNIKDLVRRHAITLQFKDYVLGVMLHSLG
jgi:hypothetical protein